MIKNSADFFSRVMQRWLPDPFIIAIILTAIVFMCGLFIERQSVTDMANHWGNGFWALLSFSMQMVLILVLGSILAMSVAVKKGLIWVAKLAATPTQAILLVTLVSMLASWINWGFGLVVGALVAREVATVVKGGHFPLLIASAYSGMLIWHSGLSGSIPLKIASQDSDALGQLLAGQTIPMTETIFAWQNLVIVAALVITVPILNILMLPDKHKRVSFQVKHKNVPSIDKRGLTPAEKLEHSPFINYLLVMLGLVFLWQYFIQGNGLSLNTINLCLLLFGLALHVSPHNFLNAAKEAIGYSSGIILQFPIYAGVMGMMVGSGLATSMSQWFVEISSAQSFPVYTFISAGIVNFFVPSGGGQWAVQAPIVLPAATELGVSINHAAMAVAWGDAWTNMIQPFWALPLLAIAGLSLRQIMGYCAVILIWSGVLISSLIYFLY
ncbi:MAG: TIGR00366 family protein [Paraglaciecola polaris]|uniref:short-chain fatty acid transporter n=1 Tax=Paraglaciecola polaris TaxID=222814 RepID=UPI0030038DAF|tara:strand:+ start:465 stop:1784 length:1320 start_codon:yes stop_codon:yes gene_type:complete